RHPRARDVRVSGIRHAPVRAAARLTESRKRDGTRAGTGESQGVRRQMMQLIKAIVRPNKVDDVKAALEKMAVSGMTVTEVRGHGQQKGHTAIYRGKEYNVSLLPKMQIETVVTESLLEATIEAIVAAARTGEIGDGRVFVTPVESSYKIRTGERES